MRHASRRSHHWVGITRWTHPDKTCQAAELLSDSGRVTIFQGSETVNLLDYRNDARIFSLDPSVPAGTYGLLIENTVLFDETTGGSKPTGKDDTQEQGWSSL